MSYSDSLGEIRFPIKASALASIVVGFLSAMFWWATRDLSEGVIFLTASAAAAGTILGAFYAARGLSLNSVALKIQEGRLAEQEARERSLFAFRFTNKWNDPSMHHVRDAIRGLLQLDHNSDEFSSLLRQKETNVIHFLNFLEELSIAIETGYADDEILKAAFGGVVSKAWTKLGPWIEETRRQSDRPLIWIKFQALASTWHR